MLYIFRELFQSIVVSLLDSSRQEKDISILCRRKKITPPVRGKLCCTGVSVSPCLIGLRGTAGRQAGLHPLEIVVGSMVHWNGRSGLQVLHILTVIKLSLLTESNLIVARDKEHRLPL